MRVSFKLLLILGIGFLNACQSEQETISPEYKKLTSAVYASGNIEPLNGYQLFAPSAGILQQKLVNAGDKVIQGQPLFIISQESSSLQLENAREKLSTAKRNAADNSSMLRDLQFKLEQAKEQYLQDSVNYERQQSLMSQNATSKTAVEQARLAFLNSKSTFQSSKVNLAQNRQDLKDRLKEAEIQYQLAAEEQGNTVMKSRINGRVYQTYLKEGEMVSTNQPLASIGDDDEFYLQLIVDERDIAKVEPGMKVLFSTEILTDSVLEAEVTKIYPYMNEENRSFRVDAIIPNTSISLYDGASVEANIIIEQKDRALVIPRAALIGEDSVLVERDGEAVKVKIVKGIQNLEMVEILSGIEEDAKLITQR
ncbi:HlyD family efflux transporter periplasmic adaptor subunit [Catalinimonas sp. 4WD22]|uniref:efflux RND transporter periplasmic adaptor subunit n=1 Tax=Catalinimonas locisalis TaxID=3133978 RepID=UPI0031016FD4